MRYVGITPVALIAALLLPVRFAEACAVCFGDPDSDMAKGAVVGVAFLAGVVGFILLGIASTAALWMVKARRLQGFDLADDHDQRGTTTKQDDDLT